MEDRAKYDAAKDPANDDHLDELVVHNATVHIEAMDAHNYMVMITRGTDPYEVYAHFTVRDLIETDDMHGIPVTIDPPLLICGEWRDRKGIRHMCTRRHKGADTYGYHKCDCGAQHEGRMP